MTRDELRKALLAAVSEPRRVEVTHLVPELAECLSGARLFVRELSGAERAAWFKANQKSLDDSDARLVALALQTEAGERVFADDDVPALMKTSAVVARLAHAAGEASGLFWRDEGKLSEKNGSSTAPSTGRRGHGG